MLPVSIITSTRGTIQHRNTNNFLLSMDARAGLEPRNLLSRFGNMVFILQFRRERERGRASVIFSIGFVILFDLILVRSAISFQC